MASRRHGSEVKIRGAMVLKDKVKGSVTQMPAVRKTTPTRTARFAPGTLPVSGEMEFYVCNVHASILNHY